MMEVKNRNLRSYDAISIGMIALGAGLRMIALPFVSDDLRYYFLPWYSEISHRGFSAVGESFYNYTPPYVILVWISSALERFFPPVFLVKFPSLVFEIFLAWGVGKLVSGFARPEERRRVFLRAFAWASVWPTVLLNGALWGQCDALYAVGVVWALVAMTASPNGPRSFAAHAAFGASFMFKLQSVFVAPLYLVLYLRKKLRPSHLLVVPAVYVLAMLPAFWAGRDMPSLLRIYLDQGDAYRSLSMNAPTFYAWISDANYDWVYPRGILFAGFALLAVALSFARRFREIGARDTLAIGAFFAWLSPCLLPKMHERYFFLAEVLTLALALSPGPAEKGARVKAFLITGLVQVVGFLTYATYLFHFTPIPIEVLPVFHVFAGLLWFFFFSERLRSPNLGS